MPNRTCTQCAIEQPLANFHSKGGGRIRSDCKSCVTQYTAEYREANREKLRLATRDRRDREGYCARERGRARELYNPEKAQKKNKEWRDQNKEWRAEYTREHRNKYPERHCAHTAVARALNAGNLTKKPCAVCGDLASEGHHESYERERWLDVVWLCGQHHKDAHRLQRENRHA